MFFYLHINVFNIYGFVGSRTKKTDIIAQFNTDSL